MSLSYWFAKKFGVPVVLLYLLAAGALIVSNYSSSGIAEPGALAAFYPPGHSYPRTTKNRTVREILGIPIADDEVKTGGETVDILSYTDDGAVIRLQGQGEEAVPAGRVIRYLVNRDSTRLEELISPLYPPLERLLDLHLRFMRRVEEGVGGGEGSLRQLIIPKAVISAVYLGLVLAALYILKRVDRAAESYHGGYSLIYGAFVYWPLAMILVSFAGTNVVDVVRHYPESLRFMRWYIVWGWASMFAWPVLVAALSAADIVRSAGQREYNRMLLHAAVLAAGLVSIPLVTVGVMFAVLVIGMYVTYRVGKRMLLPERIRKLLGR